MSYEDALERALSLRFDTAALEAFLRTVEQWRPDLEADLQLAVQTRVAVASVEPSPDAAAHAEQQLLRLVGVLEAREATAPPKREPGPGIVRRIWQGRLIVAAASAVIILAALLLSGPGGGSIAPTTAEAVLIEGSVTEVGADGITLDTAEGARTFRLW